jgi:hypothetical protein
VQAVRQIKAVRNRQVVVQLPDEFPLTDQVEVIILPAPSLASEVSAVKLEPDTVDPVVLQDFLVIDTAQFTSAQRQAYERVKTTIQKGHRPNEPRILGLFKGLIRVADDFDAPLADEGLFWGESTNESGISLDR